MRGWVRGRCNLPDQASILVSKARVSRAVIATLSSSVRLRHEDFHLSPETRVLRAKQHRVSDKWAKSSELTSKRSTIGCDAG